MNHRRWPLHPHPLKEESLVSWLARIASCYNLALDQLLQHDLGFYGDLDDLNKKISNELLTLLSQRAAISEEKVHALTLSAWSPLLLDDLALPQTDFRSYVNHYSVLIPLHKRQKFKPKKGWLPWLNPTAPIIPLRACPICIDNAPKGAISLAWYLPIMLSCPIHQCWLRHCYTYQGRHIGWGNKMSSRHSCSPMVNAMDQRTWSALTTGQVVLPRRTIHGGVWLRLLRTLLDELHIPPSSISALDANTITEIWSSLKLRPRDGISQWKPYEILPFETQEHTLMAAATAISRIENGLITPPGEHVFLFLPERVARDDLRSIPPKTLTASLSPFQKVVDELNRLIAMAKEDPKPAKDLRNVVLWGRDDAQLIQTINGLLVENGVPPEFLAS